jgi:signal transduction histidine kinase
MLNKKSCARLLFGILIVGAVLTDTCALLVHAMRPALSAPAWLAWILAIQLIVLATCAWCAARLVTRPLGRFAAAADSLGPDLSALKLAEDGPEELEHAARAFNAMQQRMAGYMAERVEILAAISHDLQTPITRMRLRTELMDSRRDQIKFLSDLDTMHALVREGVTYARTLHGTTEPPCRIDARALLESLVSDYEDAGQRVVLEGRIDEPVVTLPNALRRILMNLVDNALKFGSTVHIRAHIGADCLVIAVIDNGPGISPDQLQAVFKPFYRVDCARNQSAGGSGLGLAIARQLAAAMGAELSLHNRNEGGLEARLAVVKRPAPANWDAGANKRAVHYTQAFDEPVVSG